jgi:hypothetical protein
MGCGKLTGVQLWILTKAAIDSDQQQLPVLIEASQGIPFGDPRLDHFAQEP